MKKTIRKLSTVLIIALLNILMCSSVIAQAPETMSYQAIVRDAGGNLVVSHAVGMQISILQGSASGPAVYVETQTPTSNANGLVSIEVGGGTVVSGDFSTIDWVIGPYFIKTETDPTGGTGYSIIGTVKLMSVPYALHTKTSEGLKGDLIIADGKVKFNDVINLDPKSSEPINPVEGDMYINSSNNQIYCFLNGEWSQLITANTPIMSTKTITSITSYSAQGGGYITYDRGAAVINRGVCWSTTMDPTINDNFTRDGTGIGDFTSLITGLTANTTYYLRAYATNSVGTGYGNQKQFTTETFTDPRDGKSYEIETIGTQTWMTENLAYLPEVSPPSVGSEAANHYYVYGYDGTDVAAAKATLNYSTYGVLYNYESAKISCPVGWHLPTDGEWIILEMFLGMSTFDSNFYGWRTSGEVGRKLKSTSGWDNDGNGDNTSRFNAVPGGYMYENYFSGINRHTTIWTNTFYNANKPYTRILYDYSNGINRNSEVKNFGLSVRCIKD